MPLLTSESARCQWTGPCISCHFPERVQRRHSKPCKCPLMRCSCNCPPCTGQFSRQEAKLLFMSSSSQAESTVLRSRLPKWCYGRTSSLSSLFFHAAFSALVVNFSMAAFEADHGWKKPSQGCCAAWQTMSKQRGSSHVLLPGLLLSPWGRSSVSQLESPVDSETAPRLEARRNGEMFFHISPVT